MGGSCDGDDRQRACGIDRPGGLPQLHLERRLHVCPFLGNAVYAEVA